ncbi:MAG TPA: plastocyanin/azurin family copper-binding protein [Ktedonobacterales bacterium]|nr:plastocyanin/azurin family copper-binding protein [Ktedonobacterales bacterium]
MLRALIDKCTPLTRSVSRGALYVSLLAMVTLAACGTTGGATNTTPTDTPAPAATATTAAPTATTNPPAATVKIVGASFSTYGFSPGSVTVKVGDTVEWVNNSTVPHTSTSDSGSALSWDSGAIDTGGGTFSFTFTKAGTYAYHCSFHASMHGTIVVTG